jgi:hypothetical protein
MGRKRNGETAKLNHDVALRALWPNYLFSEVVFSYFLSQNNPLVLVCQHNGKILKIYSCFNTPFNQALNRRKIILDILTETDITRSTHSKSLTLRNNYWKVSKYCQFISSALLTAFALNMTPTSTRGEEIRDIFPFHEIPYSRPWKRFSPFVGNLHSASRSRRTPKIVNCSVN